MPFGSCSQPNVRNERERSATTGSSVEQTNAASRVWPRDRASPDNQWVVSKRKRTKRDADPLAVYRRIRKPMPPPERIVPDKRRELEDEEARREIEEER